MNAAESFLVDEYEGSKGEVQRTVAAKLGDAAAAVDLDGAYNEAWHALYLRLESGDTVDNHKAFLVTVVYRRALSERRAGRLEQATDTEELGAVGVEQDIDARLDAEMQLRHFTQGLRAQLDERELQAAALTYLYGLSRPEAAKLIGIAPRRMEKLMDRASKRINAVIGAVRPGELCDEFDSMVRAFAVGMLDENGERYQLARDHLETCSSCRRKVLVLRGLGAITPPLPAAFGTLAAAGAASAGATKLGLGAGKGGAGKASLGKVAGKFAGLSHKAALIGGAVATTGTIAAVAAVAVVSAGGGHHKQDPTGGGEPATAVVGAAPAGEAAPTSPPVHPTPHKSAHHHAKRKAHHHKHPQTKHPQKATAPKATPPPAAPEAEPETTAAATPELTYEPPPAPTPEPAPEPTPEPPAESHKPLTDASVEFELH
jgi:DNA-directed RNA polymerase specialized sigma24 family protein